MRLIACIAAATLLVPATSLASVLEHRPINTFGDLSIAGPDIPKGCSIQHSYAAKETGGVTCDTQELLEQYFAISPKLNPICAATPDKRWACSFEK